MNTMNRESLVDAPRLFALVRAGVLTESEATTELRRMEGLPPLGYATGGVVQGGSYLVGEKTSATPRS
jgi:hypothetical protein